MLPFSNFLALRDKLFLNARSPPLDEWYFDRIMFYRGGRLGGGFRRSDRVYAVSPAQNLANDGHFWTTVRQVTGVDIPQINRP